MCVCNIYIYIFCYIYIAVRAIARAPVPRANPCQFTRAFAGGGKLDHVHVRMLLTHGATATEVLRLSEKQSTDLIVLAWRGIWEAPRAAPLKDILREAHCPIMVVRT